MRVRKVAELGALREDRGLAVELDGKKILLVRAGDIVRAFGAECPHAGAPLDAGAVCNGRIVCPWHKAAFRVSDGRLLEPPALDGLPRYPVQVDASGAVLVSAQPIETPQAETTPDARRIVVIGAGAAGTAACAALREFGFGGEVTLIGREPGEPYDRTALSKFVMSGEQAPDEAPSLREEGFFERHRIDRIRAEVVALDAGAKRVELGDGRTLAYDAALVATGGTAKRPDLPGADLRGVYTLRERADAEAILKDVRKGSRAVILGGSFIGLEVASALRKQEVDVAVVTPEALPFVKQFGPRLGAMFRDLHVQNGVAFHAGATAERLEGDGRIERVVLEDGRQLPADLVIAGIGVRPATGFLRGVSLADDGGVPVDETMRAAAGLYAAGDIARFPLPGNGGSTRIEHWRVAQQHARVAGRAIMGGDARYDGVPFFWTYHFGKRFEYIGHAAAWDDVLIEGDLDEHRFVALLVKDGAVAAAVACQRERATAALIERMRATVAIEDVLALIRATGE